LTDKIKTGAILMAAGTALPVSMQRAGQTSSDSFVPGWHWINNLDSNGMDRLINQAGWNFFYFAGGIEMIAFGFDEQRATDKALKRIITSLKPKHFNCLEITSVTAKSFLGLPYVSVSAHSRHVQKSKMLFAD
jgi:hypothetical protein